MTSSQCSLIWRASPLGPLPADCSLLTFWPSNQANPERNELWQWQTVRLHRLKVPTLHSIFICSPQSISNIAFMFNLVLTFHYWLLINLAVIFSVNRFIVCTTKRQPQRRSLLSDSLLILPINILDINILSFLLWLWISRDDSWLFLPHSEDFSRTFFHI